MCGLLLSGGSPGSILKVICSVGTVYKLGSGLVSAQEQNGEGDERNHFFFSA